MKRASFDECLVYAIAVVAFVLSYTQLADLAGRAGFGDAARLWPLAVDGLAVVATRAAVRLRDGAGYARWMLGAATAVSVVAGAGAHLLPPGPLPGWAGALVAAVSPLCLLVAPHLAVQLRRDAAATTTDGTVADTDTTQDAAVADATDDDAALIDGGDTDTPALTLVVAPERAPSHDAADQARHTATPDGAPDAALFDVDATAIDAAPESREEKLQLARHLLATTRMSQRAIARRVGLSKDAVNRIVGPGGRDALRDAAGVPGGAAALVAVSG